MNASPAVGRICKFKPEPETLARSGIQFRSVDVVCNPELLKQWR
jgi:hypothetical protein